MRSRIITCSLAFLASLPVGFAVSRSAADPALKWAIVNLRDTTSIAGAFVSGPVIFVHDDTAMTRGDACTRVHRFVHGKGPGEQIVSFHCKPHWGEAPERFTTAIERVPSGPAVLTSYQFAGDSESHGVPTKAH